MRLFKLPVLLISISVLAACTKPDNKPDGVNGPQNTEGSATFRVKSMDGDGTILNITSESKDPSANLTTASVWRVPRKVSYRFTACLEDRSTRSQAIGHQFGIEIPGTRQRIADVPPTTGEGCFSWQESFPFTYFVRQSKWVVIERDIVGIGVHTGRQRVKLAINPWAVGSDARDSGDTVRFLRDKPLLEEQLVPFAQANAALSGEALGQDQLVVGEVFIQTIRKGEEKTGTLMQMKITMKPKIRFLSREGVEVNRPITSGEFDVIAHLVLNNTGPKQNERVILSSGDNNSELHKESKDRGVVGKGRVVDGKLIAFVNTWVRERMPQGNLELVLKVIPKGIRGIAPAEGIYELGVFRNLSSSFSGDLNQKCLESKSCDIASYLKGATNFEEMRKLNYGADNSPYLFDRLNLRFAQVEPGETTTQRTVTYTAATCITDAFTGERPVGLPFVIRYKETDEVIPDQKTGEDGCLRWSSTIFHKYYQPEQFLERNVVITKDSGFEREMRFYINPWDDKFTFGFDEREFKPQFWVTLRSRKKIPSRFFLADFGYHTVRFQYNIDSLMALEVRKTVLMELEPRVLRYSGIVNARKMTEPLRDGIWYMKVGIQKNYLDPAQAGVHVDALKEAQSDGSQKPNLPPSESEKSLRLSGVQQVDSKNARNRLRRLGIDVPQREFISTQKALVRSTDGVIIQPVEFTMQDLRMMRVRSNFLIEMQPVDERQLQVENVLRGNFGRYLDDLAAKRKADNDLLGTAPDGPAVEPAKKIAEEDERIKKKIEDRRKSTRELFGQISSQLRQGNASGISLEPFRLTEQQMAYFGKDVQEMLDDNLATNDFTTIKLPPCSEIDCDKFVEQGESPDDLGEKGPGLARRTFVGPVIFLSNGYKDSVRATDNLDEAKCGQKVQFDDDREREMDEYRRKLFTTTEEVVSKARENTLYKYSEYFGSLRHLCNTHVDDLIAREEKYRFIYDVNIPAVGSVSNLTKAYGMDFLSLTDEQPKSVTFDGPTLEKCGNNLTNCMRETNENWVPLKTAMDVINRNLERTDGILVTIKKWLNYAPEVKRDAWTNEDLRASLFNPPNAKTRRYASCALVVNNLVTTGLKNSASRSTVARTLMDQCLVSSNEPVFFDNKLRVFKTGQSEDSYVFLGGYQMNINVGQSFSVGRSTGWSASAGLELVDVVGLAPVGKVVGAILKPVSAKVGWSSSMSESDGTSISESTYLVAQVAKFRVRLDEYEQCYGLSLTNDFLDSMSYVNDYALNEVIPELRKSGRNLFVCEGVVSKEARYVDETYFYFTQHFTEGDMLDQADLYNHPWLLALRGNRDFATFISLIRRQDQISFWSMAKNTYSPQKRTVDWPLAHMRNVYRQIVPSFPGFYTVLENHENLTEFPLEMSKTDPDMNNEVRSRDRRSEPDRRTPN